jgi:hypothetical protein
LPVAGVAIEIRASLPDRAALPGAAHPGAAATTPPSAAAARMTAFHAGPGVRLRIASYLLLSVWQWFPAGQASPGAATR